MKKTAIVYSSIHQGNTYKIVKAISDKYDIDLIDVSKDYKVDLSKYSMIGFASGIDFGRFYPEVEICLKRNLPENKNIFFIYTCAKTNNKFTKSIEAEALKKNAKILGIYGCKGYNTYGPWKLIGGMNKNHPNKYEIDNAIKFYENILQINKYENCVKL